MQNSVFNKWQILRKLQEIREDKQMGKCKGGLAQWDTLNVLKCMLFMEHTKDSKLQRKKFREEKSMKQKTSVR